MKGEQELRYESRLLVRPPALPARNTNKGGVLIGIAGYGIGDYFFDFSGSIDKAVGRKSELWKN